MKWLLSKKENLMRLLGNSGSEITIRGELGFSDFDSLTAVEGARAIGFVTR